MVSKEIVVILDKSVKKVMLAMCQKKDKRENPEHLAWGVLMEGQDLVGLQVKRVTLVCLDMEELDHLVKRVTQVSESFHLVFSYKVHIVFLLVFKIFEFLSAWTLVLES
jgi:hypothetical protein